MLEKFLKEYVSIVAGSGTDKIVDVLFNKIVPEFEENYKKSLLKSKFGETINGE